VNHLDSAAGVGGHYNIQKNHVKIFSRPGPFIVELMAHELGHRYWYKHMSSTQRARFTAWFESGAVPAVSRYGGHNEGEAFAEVIAYVVTGKTIGRDQLESLKAVLNDKGTKLATDISGMVPRVAARYLRALEANVFDENMDHDFEDFVDPLDKLRQQWMDLENGIITERNKFRKKYLEPLLNDPTLDEQYRKDIADLLEANSRDHRFALLHREIRLFDKEPFLDEWKKARNEAKKVLTWFKSRYGKDTDPEKLDSAAHKAINELSYALGPYAATNWNASYSIRQKVTTPEVVEILTKASSKFAPERDYAIRRLSYFRYGYRETNPRSYAEIVQELLDQSDSFAGEAIVPLDRIFKQIKANDPYERIYPIETKFIRKTWDLYKDMRQTTVQYFHDITAKTSWEGRRPLSDLSVELESLNPGLDQLWHADYPRRVTVGSSWLMAKDPEIRAAIRKAVENPTPSY
jgi:hypothetical protein